MPLFIGNSFIGIFVLVYGVKLKLTIAHSLNRDTLIILTSISAYKNILRIRVIRFHFYLD